MNISPSRLAAFEILEKIELERAFSSNLLPIYEESLSEKDRALCHELTLGTLRRQIYLDRVIELFSKSKKLDIPVLIALRLGLYQLLFLDRVPDYSAINESVELVKQSKKRSASGMVNAILRRATREEPVLKFRDEIEQVSVETSHPRWLIDRWIAQFGAVEAFEIAAGNNSVPQVAFRRTNNHHELVDDLPSTHPSEFVDACLLADRITPELRHLEQKHAIYFQDEASQMVAASIELKSGDKFLDVCASPGSKSTAIAINSHSSTANVIAGDISDRRIDFLRKNCEDQGVSDVSLVQYDAVVDLPFAENSFDSVLVDAPCSGTGTIRHNPEIRYNLRPADLKDLPDKQLKILRNASNMVKGGGVLVYSTCSLEHDENEAVCEAFLALCTDFIVSKPLVPERLIDRDGFARTFPHRDNMDGFFIAAFQKR